MEVGGYRIYYISQNMEPEEIMNLVETSMASQLALVIHQNHIIGQNDECLDKFAESVLNSGKQIVLINPDIELAEKLTRAGLIVYPNLDALKAGEEFWFEDRVSLDNKSPETVDNKKMFRLLPFVGMILVLILAGIYFLYPTVTIEIKPVVKTLDENLSVRGEINSDGYLEDSLISLNEFEVAVTDETQIETSGHKLVGTTKATGKIRFINETREKVEIPKETIVYTPDEVEFKTLKSVIIPPLQVDYLMDVPVGMKAGQAEVEIQALEKGSRGNVDTGQITKGLDINGVYVINSSPTQGGEDQKISIIAEKDREKAKNLLSEVIKDRLISKIYQELGGNFRVIENEIEYSDIEYEFDGEIGEKTETLRCTGHLTATGLLINNRELDKLTTDYIKEQIGQNYRLFSSTVVIEDINLEKIDNKLYNIKLGLKASVMPKLKTINLADKLAGLPLSKALKFLSGHEDIEDFTIKGQRKAMPRFKYAIRVVVSEPGDYPVFKEQK